MVLVYIGHGEFPDEMSGDFYLMPTDADKLTDRGAINFANFLNDCLKPPRTEWSWLSSSIHATPGLRPGSRWSGGPLPGEATSASSC
jgi:hypothetical protein